MARVTGVGGVFFKSTGDNAALAAWYQKHLGMPLEDFGGAVLRWSDDTADDKGLTVWHVAAKDSKWFASRVRRRAPESPIAHLSHRVGVDARIRVSLRPTAPLD